MSPPALDPALLDRLPPELHDAVEAQVAAVVNAEREARTRAERDRADMAERVARLEHLIAELRRARFGRSSEKLSADQLEMAFEDIETAIVEMQAEAGAAAGPAREPDGASKSHRRSRALPKDLPREERVIEPGDLTCPCGCGRMVRIGEDRSERLDVAPARLRVIVTVRPRYACPKGRTGVRQAPVPPAIIEGGLPTEATLAHVVVSKFADHLPLYRQAQIMARQGAPVDRATLSDWTGRAAFHLRPVVDRMARHVKTGPRLFADETTAPVLDPGRGRTKTGYLWAMLRDDRPYGGAYPPAVVFEYAPGRSGEHADWMLAGFEGILHVDGYAGYNRLADDRREGGDPLRLSYCWAHARREIIRAMPNAGSPVAEDLLGRIAALYKIEATIRGASADARLAERQARSKPILKALRAAFDLHAARLSKKSEMGRALAYILARWEGLTRFAEDGRIEMDTNAVENAIRPLALGRKNALFAGHDEGGRTWARLASLVGTCRLNGVEPFAYLTATLEAIARGHPAADIDALMPWAFAATSTKSAA
ncbi:IS66 family transposase [Jannaschia formosa]|uniref:IS66 family transposase n=1 Tax=Jannaschia formosa TaxID=2259592 RepID=UPI000E1BEF1F|nr:IS66 family transposase [Jannaschia formosa]TFL16578.1 IS66 family transposase [Jannaschia formosa]